MASTEHISYLLFRHLQETLSEAEQGELSAWIGDSRLRLDFVATISSEEGLRRDMLAFRPDVQAATEAAILEKIMSRRNGSETIAGRAAHRVHFLKTAWFKYAAAIIILLGIGAYLWNNYTSEQNSSPTATITPSSHDILPGGWKAILTLADGREIILDSAQNGQLAIENGSEVIKRGDQIIYDAGQIQGEAVVYNTMSTPRGGQYQLTLSDGTKVWLNAASKIIYPTRFIGNTRKVTIEGEVYFEVKSNKSKPFIVQSGKDQVMVLGTSFNIHSYLNEVFKTSLIEGSIKVNEKIIQPGHAYVNGKIVPTNVEQDVAWKNGVFNFSNSDLVAVMRQIERWYDVQVIFAGKIPAVSLEGKLPREFSLQQVLAAFSDNRLRYKLEGKQLIILP